MLDFFYFSELFLPSNDGGALLLAIISEFAGSKLSSNTHPITNWMDTVKEYSFFKKKAFILRFNFAYCINEIRAKWKLTTKKINFKSIV